MDRSFIVPPRTLMHTLVSLVNLLFIYHCISLFILEPDDDNIFDGILHHGLGPIALMRSTERLTMSDGKIVCDRIVLLFPRCTTPLRRQ